MVKQLKEIKLLPNAVKEKLLITLLLIFLIRIGNFIDIPGVNRNSVFNLTKSNVFVPSLNTNLLNSSSIPSLFCFGIGPSINASIIIQLFIAISPNLKKFQREEGNFARKKISQYTRYLTVFLSFTQSFVLIFSLRSSLYNWNLTTAFELCCFLTAGSMIVLWISEKITKNGITNGASLLVFLNIITSTPQQVLASFSNINIYQLILIFLTYMINISGVIFLQQSVRYIPLMTSKAVLQNSGTKLSKQKTFFPVKLNQAGVMPIVFTSYLLPLIKSFTLFLISNVLHISFILPKLLTQFIYYSTEFILICLFTNFYTLILVDPKDISENLQKTGFFIPGIRPGKQTFLFLEKLFNRQSFIGGIILAINTLFLNIVGLYLNLPSLQGISISSQIIIVGVTIEIVEKIRSLILSDIYQNLESKK